MHWDQRHGEAALDGFDGIIGIDGIEPSPHLAAHQHRFPTAGRGLDVACGRGLGSVWLAGRGLDVLGVDVSPVAIDLAAELATRHGLADRCRFEVADLDGGLPASAAEGPGFDVVLCHLFRDPALDDALVDRLRPGGLLAVVALSEVGHGPGRFRARPGELGEAFGHGTPPLSIELDEEGDGVAVLLGRRSL